MRPPLKKFTIERVMRFQEECLRAILDESPETARRIFRRTQAVEATAQALDYRLSRGDW